MSNPESSRTDPPTVAPDPLADDVDVPSAERPPSRRRRPPVRGRRPPVRGRRPPEVRRRRRLVLAVLAGPIVVLACLSFAHAAKAARAAIDGKAALLRSEKLISRQELEPARAELLLAKTKFQATRREMASATRFLPIVRYVPLVRTQVKAVEKLADAGLVLSDAGISLSDAAAVIVEPGADEASFANALGQLRTIRGLLASGLSSIDSAASAVDELRGAFLPGPVGDARSQFRQRLPAIRERAADSESALAAMITFVGGNGPRNYLFLSQNPDEVRPTGGFIGTYGVLSATGGELAVNRFEAIESWMRDHPNAVATDEERGGLFRIDTRQPQRIANVNVGPDWPQAAELAARLWERGQEAPVDGAISFTPAFLARILRVTGPVDVAGYDERVTSDNLIERIDFYAHEKANELFRDRKDFIAVLGEAVLERLIGTRTSQWTALSKAIGEAFDAREAMAWSTDPEVAQVLAERRWDGSVPAVSGDFVHPAEFQYSAKNGRALRRTYQHRVTVQTDGSGTVATTARIVNPSPPDPGSNPAGGLNFITMYGPEGASLGTGSDPLSLSQPTVAGHPAVAWFRPLTPESETTVQVVWSVPQILRPLEDGRWEYSLLWMRHPDHKGDVLLLSFELPKGWHWDGPVPPGEVALDVDFSGRWILAED